MKPITPLAALILAPLSAPLTTPAIAQDAAESDSSAVPDEVDWAQDMITMPYEDGLRFRIEFLGTSCAVSYGDEDKALFAYTVDEDRNPHLMIFPSPSWAHGAAQVPVLIGSGKPAEEEGQFTQNMTETQFLLDTKDGGTVRYTAPDPGWDHVDLYDSYSFTIMYNGDEESGDSEDVRDGRYPLLTYSFDQANSRGAAVFFEECRDWLQAREGAAPPPPAPPPPPPPPPTKPEITPVFWNEMDGNYSVSVRSVGDSVCAVDFINLAEERLVNLVREADSGAYTLSLILGDFGAAPSGSPAALNIAASSKEPATFDFAGTVESADDVLQTIAGPLTYDQASAILRADRVTIRGNGAQLLDLAVPISLRVQAQLKMLQCHLDRK